MVSRRRRQTSISERTAKFVFIIFSVFKNSYPNDRSPVQNLISSEVSLLEGLYENGHLGSSGGGVIVTSIRGRGVGRFTINFENSTKFA